MLFLMLEEYPSPKYLDLRNMKADENIEVKRRKQWIDKMGTGHKLYNLTVECLLDEPKDRPTMNTINKKVTELHSTNEVQQFHFAIDSLCK